MTTEKQTTLHIDLTKRVVFVNGKEMYLSYTEYCVLERLYKSRNTAVSKKDLHEGLYYSEPKTQRKLIDVIICRLRQKIGKISGDNSFLQTIWGYGYILTDDVEN